jgi:hypothetical protein
MRVVKKLLKAAAILAAIAVVLVLIPIVAIELGCRGSGERRDVAAVGGPSLVTDVPNYTRPQSSTYFTFPEWYIVYVADDFGRMLDRGSESDFGYLSAISGFWSSFCTIKQRTAGWAEPASDVTVMIYTIGISFTAEYIIKGLYENTIGRVTEWLRGNRPTDEDEFARYVAQDYAQFLYKTPWYKYPFGQRVGELWSQPATGSGFVRKWERRVALTMEYGVKAGYAWLINRGLDATSGEDERDIMFVAQGLTDEDLRAEPRIKVVKDLGNGLKLAVAPRYGAFTDIALALSRKGRVIREIAGNRMILLTALLPEGVAPAIPGATEMFAMPLTSRPGWRRVGYDVAVPSLTEVVQAFDRDDIKIDHLFDY